MKKYFYLLLMSLFWAHGVSAQNSSNKDVLTDVVKDVETAISNELRKIDAAVNSISQEVKNNPNLTKDAERDLKNEINQKISDIKNTTKKYVRLIKEKKLTPELKKDLKKEVNKDIKQLKKIRREINKH